MVSTRRHLEALTSERDRRYAREAELRAEALRIDKENARMALVLARENQVAKEKQHNDVLGQWQAERGNFATKVDLAAAIERWEEGHKPVVEFIASQVGRSSGTLDARAVILAITGLLIGAATVAVAVMAIIAAVLVAVLNG